MTESTAIAPSVREQQLTAVLALGAALENDLPPLNWTLYPTDPLKLDGLAYESGQTDEECRAAVAAWARFLGVGVVSTECSDKAGTWVKVQAVAERSGAQFRIWASVDKKAVSA